MMKIDGVCGEICEATEFVAIHPQNTPFSSISKIESGDQIHL